MLWPATGPDDGPGRALNGHVVPAIKLPGPPLTRSRGVRFGKFDQDFLLRRACRYASQANSSAPAKAIAPVINRVVFMGCAPGCRGRFRQKATIPASIRPAATSRSTPSRKALNKPAAEMMIPSRLTSSRVVAGISVLVLAA